MSKTQASSPFKGGEPAVHHERAVRALERLGTLCYHVAKPKKECGCQETVFTNSLVGTKTGGRPTVRDLQKAADRLVDEMPSSFHGALAYIMKGRCTVDELVRRIPISRSTLLRLRTEERKQYSLDQVIAICIGLHLPPWLSEILLDRARLSVQRFGPYAYYGMILDCFYLDTIYDVQQFIADNGYEPLQLNFDTE